MDSTPADKVLKKTLLDLQNISRDTVCVSQMLGGPFWRLGIPMERLSIPPGTGWGGKDTGWLSTWECPLRTDSASWKSIESIIQLFSFRNSCILLVSSRIVSRSSTNFLLAIVSNVELWNRFNSSISLRLCSRASRRSQFCFNYSLWRSCWSFRRRSSAWWARQISSFFATRSFHTIFEYFFYRNRPGIRVFESLLDSQRELALFLSLQECLNLFARNLWTKWANNWSFRSVTSHWRRQTGRQAFFFRVIGSSSARVKERLADGDVIVVEVIREPLLAGGLLGVFDINLCDEVVVGLITCERVVLGKGCQGPQRKCAGYVHIVEVEVVGQ